MTEKYKVGDRVQYWKTYYKESFCESCGHDEIDSYRRRREGVIEGVHYDYIIRPFDYNEATTTTELRPDGVAVVTPYYSDMKPSVQEPVYTIAKATYTEDEIIKLLTQPND
jgi:hypothetical protein